MLPYKRSTLLFATSQVDSAPIGVGTLNLFHQATIYPPLLTLLILFSSQAFPYSVAIIQYSQAYLAIVASQYTQQVLYAIFYYTLFLAIIYISSSLIFQVVLSVISVSILSAPYLPPTYALGISLLLASKALFNLDSIVVEPGFILKAIYNHSLTGQCYLYLLYQQADYQGTARFGLLEP